MEPLVSTAWLAGHVDEPDLRVLECTVNLRHGPGGYFVETGLPDWTSSHIPGAVNVPANGLVDPESNRFLPSHELAARFAGVRPEQRVIAYCGGGIAATADAFVLTLLGHSDVGVYDGSMEEWAANPALPLELGD